MDTREAADILKDVRDRIAEALDEARMAIRDADPDLWPSAKGYWWAHILCALDNEHEFLGGSMQTMQDTIDALEREEED